MEVVEPPTSWYSEHMINKALYSALNNQVDEDKEHDIVNDFWEEIEKIKATKKDKPKASV
jgi:hypothetical protein